MDTHRITEDTRFCPVCGADWFTSPIPETARHLYRPGATHFSRLVGVYSMEEDRTTHWECPDCKSTFPR